MKRIGLVFSKGAFAEMLDSIDRDNKDLQEFTHENEDLGHVRQRRRGRCPHESLQLVRKYARSLYEVLVTGASWSCKCQNIHVVSLQLETRPGKAEIEAGRNTQSPTFRVLLSGPKMASLSEESRTTVPGEWREFDIRPFEVRIVEEKPSDIVNGSAQSR